MEVDLEKKKRKVLRHVGRSGFRVAPFPHALSLHDIGIHSCLGPGVTEEEDDDETVAKHLEAPR